MLFSWKKILGIGCFVISIAACRDDDPPVVMQQECEKTDVSSIDYNPTYSNIAVPVGFPPLPQPSDNLATEEGISLGRKLFYDKKLSSDGTMSCASCHLQSGNFTDNVAFSTGVTGAVGVRSSMSLLNVAYLTNGLFWDGRSPNLEAQALLPVEDQTELHENWDSVIVKLQKDADYPALFRKAFGINTACDMTKEMAAKAIAQFERTLVSTGNSKWDKRIRQEPGVFFTDSELRGFDMFFDISADLPDAECGHCHNAPLFSTVEDFLNNGLQEAATLADFRDKGFGNVSGRDFDNGKFRAPSLRNIEFSAPYMHNGSLATLEEVMEHYNSGGHPSPNLNPLIRPLGLTESQKKDVINFMKTLSDPDFLTAPQYSDPN